MSTPRAARSRRPTAAWTSPTLDGQLYGQPLVVAGRVFAATENDTVYALAADSGAVLWSTHVWHPGGPGDRAGLCGDIDPTVGITVDPGHRHGPRRRSSWWPTRQAPPIAAHHLIGLDLYTGAVLLDEVIDPPGSPIRPPSSSGPRWPSTTGG